MLGVVASLLLFASIAGWPWAGGASLQARLAGASFGEILAWWGIATRNTVALVLVTTLVATLCGGLLGALGVYGGKSFGGPLLRLLEFVGAVPALILVGVLRFADPSGGSVALLVALTLFRTLEVAQLVRAHVLSTLPSGFVEASRALGASRRWQLRVHVLPRLARPLVVNLLLGAATLVGLEAALSFSGLGLPSHVASWGGGLAAFAGGGSNMPLGCTAASIGLTSAALYGLGARLAKTPRGDKWTGPARPAEFRELGAGGLES